MTTQHVFSPLIFVMLFSLSGCKLPISEYNTGPLGIPINSDSFTIAWNYPEDQISTLPSSINYFNVYYSYLKGEEWGFLSATEGSETKVTAHFADFLGSGNYLIAVEGVKNNGEKTNLITSLDFDSFPRGGWYINLQN